MSRQSGASSRRPVLPNARADLPDEIADAYRSLALAAQRVLGPDHGFTFDARHWLAHWTGHSRDFAAAAYLFHRLWEDRAAALGADHPDLARTATAVAY